MRGGGRLVLARSLAQNPKSLNKGLSIILWNNLGKERDFSISIKLRMECIVRNEECCG